MGAWVDTEFCRLHLDDLPLMLLGHHERGPSDLNILRQNSETTVLASHPSTLPRRSQWIASLGLIDTVIQGQRYEKRLWEDPVNRGTAVVPGTFLECCAIPEWRAIKNVPSMQTGVCLITLSDLAESEPVRSLFSACSTRLSQLLQSSVTSSSAVYNKTPTILTSQTSMGRRYIPSTTRNA